MKTTFTAWAIDTKSDEGHGFIGRYWYWKSRGGWQKIPDSLEGCKDALFKTREIARKYLPDVKGRKGDGEFHAFPKAQVVKVTVTIESAA